MKKKKILILFAHPAFEKSRVNAQLIKELQNHENITFHDLYELYPEFDFDIKQEQKLLMEHDVIVFHHPFYWYNVPAILKEWQDLVLEHGWAYGKNDKALKNKWFMSIITTGGAIETYCSIGSNKFTIRELLVPFEQTANLCEMIFIPPFVVYGAYALTDEKLMKYRTILAQTINKIIEGEIEPEKLQAMACINENLL